MKTTQPFFPEFDALKEKDFGGAFVKGHAREQRPLSMKRPLHVVMRSTRATGDRSFLAPRFEAKIRAIVTRAAEKQGVKLYRYANSGNHLHLVVLPGSRRAFARFVRGVTGVIARLVLSVERGRPQAIKFWDALPFTRILEWGRDFKRACAYVRQNTLEALGFIPHQPRSRPKARVKRKRPLRP